MKHGILPFLIKAILFIVLKFIKVGVENATLLNAPEFYSVLVIYYDLSFCRKTLTLMSV